MIDFEALAAAMGELDEDTVKELLEEVMADGGQDANKAMEACQKGMDTVGIFGVVNGVQNFLDGILVQLAHGGSQIFKIDHSSNLLPMYVILSKTK